MKANTESSIGYINAGGRGTRLNGLFTPNPETGIAKGMLETGNPKIKLIDHHIANLRQQDIEKVVVAAGDQSELYEYVSDTYANDKDLRVTRSLGQLGTGGDLVVFAREEFGESHPVLIQNVDTILDINLKRFIQQYIHRRKLGAQACIALTLNTGVPNEGAFLVGADDRVIHSTEFNDENETIGADGLLEYQGSSTGAVVIDPEFVRRQTWQEKSGQLSLYRQTLRQAWQVGGLYGYNNGHGFFRDIGTVSTWLDSEDDAELQSLLRYNAQ